MRVICLNEINKLTSRQKKNLCTIAHKINKAYLDFFSNEIVFLAVFF